jgi:spermidine synthase
MVRGVINLNRKTPEKVLILGGGDGLLARELLKIEGVESITLIDLDPKMIELSRTYPPLLKLNEGALNSDRVEVMVGDAFIFLKETNKKWDAILIDFPLPYSFDLSRLYSTEFYSLIKQRLTEAGGALFDAPLLIKVNENGKAEESEAINILASTLKQSGIENPFIFGAYEGFIYFNKKDEKRNFDYTMFSEDLSGSALINMVSLDVFYPHKINNNYRVNSIFSPIRFIDER